MYIVSPQPLVHSTTSNMLALNVDRLVGNGEHRNSPCPAIPTGTNNNLKLITLSPDSGNDNASDIMSPISVSPPVSNQSSTPPSPPTKSPSHFSKITLLLNNNNNNNSSTITNAMISSASNISTPMEITPNNSQVKAEWNSEDESESQMNTTDALKERGENCSPSVGETETKECNNTFKNEVGVRSPVLVPNHNNIELTSGLPENRAASEIGYHTSNSCGDESSKKQRSLINHPFPHNHLHHHHELLHYHYGRDDNKDTSSCGGNSNNSSIDDDQLVNRERPPSRPPSSGSTISCTSSVSPCSGLFSQPQLHNLPSSTTTVHRFSIHDILQPEFGQRAIQKIRFSNFITLTSSRGLNTKSPHNKNNNSHNRSKNNNNSLPRDSSSERSSSTGSLSKPSRPSSVKNHSEDSNSSCTSSRSRKEEIVDETKVNPEVPKGPLLWPAWVYCTRYSDRPSSGPRSRRITRKSEGGPTTPRNSSPDEKRPRTAFTAEQLGKLKKEFDENRYLTEKRRQDLARDLKLHENQIKIWFQNKRAKLKKSTGQRNGLALQLMAQGLYNHSTVPMDEDEDYLPC